MHDFKRRKSAVPGWSPDGSKYVETKNETTGGEGVSFSKLQHSLETSKSTQVRKWTHKSLDIKARKSVST